MKRIDTEISGVCIIESDCFGVLNEESDIISELYFSVFSFICLLEWVIISENLLFPIDQSVVILELIFDFISFENELYIVSWLI